MLPGVSEAQAASLRRRGITLQTLRRRFARNGESDPVIAELPIAARAELAFRPVKTVPLERAERLAERLKKHLTWGTRRIHLVGSARRGKPILKDIDLLLVLPDSYPRDDAALAAKMQGRIAIRPAGRRSVQVRRVYASGPRRCSAIVGSGGTNYRVDFFLAFEDELPYALFHHTGSSRYNIRIRAHAKDKGWKLNQYGLYYRASGQRVRGSSRIRSEQDLAEFLGVTYRLPSQRER
jgi:DNA polymerase/3'-5' exonuclease PolX